MGMRSLDRAARLIAWKWMEDHEEPTGLSF
jgi:hypothetical protein